MRRCLQSPAASAASAMRPTQTHSGQVMRRAVRIDLSRVGRSSSLLMICSYGIGRRVRWCQKQKTCPLKRSGRARQYCTTRGETNAPHLAQRERVSGGTLISRFMVPLLRYGRRAMPLGASRLLTRRKRMALATNRARKTHTGQAKIKPFRMPFMKASTYWSVVIVRDSGGQ
jgi:hypothetical protein